MQKPLNLSADVAKQRILLILDEGTWEVSGHCAAERMPERGVTDLDLVNALRTGIIRREPEWEEEYGNWKYRVEGEDTEGNGLVVIVVINEAEMELFIVTVF